MVSVLLPLLAAPTAALAARPDAACDAPIFMQRHQTAHLVGRSAPVSTASCHTAVQGDECYRHVVWAHKEGIHSHPQWYPGLSPGSSFEDFQRHLWSHGLWECPEPCASAPPPTTPTPAPTPATTAVAIPTPVALQEGACYITECGCPGAFRQSWCSEGNAQNEGCLRSQTLCESSCRGQWCPADGDPAIPVIPTEAPTLAPTSAPTPVPTAYVISQTSAPTVAPIAAPTLAPTSAPTRAPTAALTPSPTAAPSPTPVALQEGACYITECGCPGAFLQSWCSEENAQNVGCLRSQALCESRCGGQWCPDGATAIPTIPTEAPAPAPTSTPTPVPTAALTPSPTATPTAAPTVAPTAAPTLTPTNAPTRAATAAPTAVVTELAPGYTATGVKGTMWADATDSGGCEMPQASYAVHHAVAIGDAYANGLLSAQSSSKLCGQVVSVSCGGDAVEAVVASICNKNAYNCGIDLIRTTWDVATGGMPPGIYDQCTVTLRDTLPMSSGSVECFFRPSSEYGNQWYASVGVFNTGGRLPTSATLNGHGGTFNGDSAYFDFNGYVGHHEGSLTPLVVTFTDGTSMSVPYGSCEWVGQAYIWSS